MSTEFDGWDFFELMHLQPLREKYSTSQLKLGFGPEAIEFVKQQGRKLPPELYHKFCKKLSRFCETVHQGEWSSKNMYPYTIRTPSGRNVTLEACRKVLRKTLK